MRENIFDSPTPGESLTNTPGNAAWEHPPQFTDLEEASDYIWDIIHEEEYLTQVITFLRNDIPIEAIARMILFGGFVEGKWTPDLAILLAEIVFKQIMAIGMKAKIPNIKMFIGDQSTNKFHKAFAKFNIEKEDAENQSVDKTKIKKFTKEVKKELQEKKSSGLMSKEYN